MIPKAYIDAWRSVAPWNESSQVEQDLVIDMIIECFHSYMQEEENKAPTAREFQLNLEEKMQDNEFTGDITALLRPEIEYDHKHAYKNILKTIISRL